MRKLLVLCLAAVIFASFAVAAKPEQQDKGPLSKITLIHYRNGYFAKPGIVCGNGVCEPGESVNKCPADCGGSGGDTSTCYAFISKGLKWKSLENYEIDPDGTSISQADVVSVVNAGVAEWETYGGNIFGSDSVRHDCVFNQDSVDDRNCVMFGLIFNSNIIGVTNVWGYYSGPPSTREIVEFDMVFNTYYTWDIAYNPYAMDLQNIATHELGHAAGMNDLYTTGCVDETMYGYSTEGETKKRTLNTGDITGIRALY